MTVIIDRFEGEYAIVEMEVGKTIPVPKILFPHAQEGDIVTIEIQKDETKQRKEHIQTLMDELFIEEKNSVSDENN